MDRQSVQAKIEQSPFNEFLGVEVSDLEEGAIEFRVPFDEQFARSDRDSYHGGVLSSLIDTAATFAVMTEIDEVPPTVNLEIDFMRPTSAAESVVTGAVIRAGSTVAFAEAEVTQEYQGERTTVARGRGLFSVGHSD